MDMVYDLDMLKAFYASFEKKIGRVRAVLQRPLTLAEKILYTHLYDDALLKKYKRGEDYVNFRPDRVAMQDATAQMALLQFINAGKETVAVLVSCQHRKKLLQLFKPTGYRGGKTGGQRNRTCIRIRTSCLFFHSRRPGKHPLLQFHSHCELCG